MAMLFQVGIFSSHAQVYTLFSEDFNGYTSFPNQNPSGDYVNLGIPQISEGADEFWYAARFQGTGSSSNSIDSDLFVQKYGDSFDGHSGVNNTPVARFEDDAGILLAIDTTGYTSITLSFDWRTFNASGGDRVVVGYYVGNLGFDAGANRYLSLSTGSGAWSNWNQLMSGSPRSSFKHEVFNLPLASDAGNVYVAFWLNNGEGENGKLDNVVVKGTLIPEPTTAALTVLAATSLLMRRRSAA